VYPATHCLGNGRPVKATEKAQRCSANALTDTAGTRCRRRHLHAALPRSGHADPAAERPPQTPRQSAPARSQTQRRQGGGTPPAAPQPARRENHARSFSALLPLKKSRSPAIGAALRAFKGAVTLFLPRRGSGTLPPHRDSHPAGSRPQRSGRKRSREKVKLTKSEREGNLQSR